MHHRYHPTVDLRNSHPAWRREPSGSRVRLSICLFAAALLALPGSPAGAQESTPGDTASARDSVAIPLDPITVTVSKLPLRPSRSGFAVTVVPPVAIEAERPTYAVEALRELPGAFIDEATGPGGPAIVRLRGGEEVFTQILMDGVQVNENGGFFDFQGVTLSNIGRIEVARGPQSALYGSSAVSGVVQLITPRGEEGAPGVGGTLEGEAGTGNGRAFQAKVDVRGGGAGLLYSGGAGIAYNRGIYELPHDTWTRDASLRLDGHAGDAIRLTGVFRYIGIDTHHPVRDPGVTRVPLDPNARLERDRYVMTARARYDASPRWTHGIDVSAFRHDFTYIDQFDGIEQPTDFFVVDADLTSTNDLWRTTVEYVGSYTSAADAAAAALGAAYGARWERENLSTALTGDFGDDASDRSRETVAGFVDLRGRPHRRVDVMVGARAERYEGLSTEITPRGSLVFRAIPELLSLRAAAGRAFKAPNLREQFQDDPFIAPNPELEAETSVSWEVGANVQPVAGLALEFTWFHQDYDNLIRTVTQENDTRLQSRNVGESRAWGVEADLRYRVRPDLEAGVEASRTWTEVLDNTGLPAEQYPEGRALPFRPDLLASGYVQALVLPRTELLARGTWVGQQTVLTERFSGRRAVIDGYFRLDATVNYRVAPSRTVYVRVANILDTRYQTAFDRPGIPLTAALGIRFEP